MPKVAMQYFGDDGHRIHMMFNFHVNQHLFYALATTPRSSQNLKTSYIAARTVELRQFRSGWSAAVVGDIIAEIGHRRGIYGRNPYSIDA